jgi:hypothetical protein
MNIFSRSQKLILILSALSLVDCSNTSLYRSNLTSTSKAGINFCTTPAQNIVTNLKYLFVIDHSGSNQQNYIPDPLNPGNYIRDPAGGTDAGNSTAIPAQPPGSKRFPPLIQFLQGMPDSPTTYYASISFSDVPTTELNWSSAGGTRTTNAQAVSYFQNFLPPNGTTHDGGNTDYVDTLTMISKLINTDIQSAQTDVQNGKPLISSDYVIIWISDGAPYVNGVLQAANTVYGSVQSLMSLKTQFPDYIDSITLSTGYYTTPTATSEQVTAQQYMSNMATYGQGSFIFFGANTSIDYSKFSVPARAAKYTLQDFWIQNASTVWWNGQLMLDSDHDGIPDTIETQMGSDPSKYDSDGNGVGDGVEYSIYGSPCQDVKCNPTLARQFQTQCGKLPASGIYPDTDGDFLNNCEETLLNSKYDDFDSNQDGVPDEFEWVNKVSFVAATNNLQSNPMNDGLSNYFKLKGGYPIQSSSTSLKDFIPMSYSLAIAPNGDSPTQTCYQVAVKNLATLADQNTIRVYAMETRGATGSVRHMRVAQKNVSNGVLTLNDGDFSP